MEITQAKLFVQPHVLRLPDELWEEVISYFHYTDISATSLACRRLHRLVKPFSFSQTLRLEKRNGLRQFKIFRNFLDRFPEYASKFTGLESDSDDASFVMDVIPKLDRLEKLTLRNDHETCLPFRGAHEDGDDDFFERASLRADNAELTLTSLRTLHLDFHDGVDLYWDYHRKSNAFLLPYLENLTLQHMMTRYPNETPCSFRSHSNSTNLTTLELEDCYLNPPILEDILFLPRALQSFSLRNPAQSWYCELVDHHEWTLDWYLEALHPQKHSLKSIKFLLADADDSPVKLENLRTLENAEFDLSRFTCRPWWMSDDNRSTVMSSTLKYLTLWVESRLDLWSLSSLILQKKTYLPKLEMVTFVIRQEEASTYMIEGLGRKLENACLKRGVGWYVQAGNRFSGTINNDKLIIRSHPRRESEDSGWSSGSSNTLVGDESPTFRKQSFVSWKGSQEVPLIDSILNSSAADATLRRTSSFQTIHSKDVPIDTSSWFNDVEVGPQR